MAKWYQEELLPGLSVSIVALGALLYVVYFKKRSLTDNERLKRELLSLEIFTDDSGQIPLITDPP